MTRALAYGFTAFGRRARKAGPTSDFERDCSLPEFHTCSVAVRGTPDT